MRVSQRQNPQHVHRSRFKEHDDCRRWLTDAAAAGDAIGLSELVEAALLRIPALPRLALVPMVDTLGFWKDDLWSYPGTRRLAPGPRHTAIFSGSITSLGLCGNDVNDVWLAAPAIEHRATLVSTDQGFSRFPGLSWINLCQSAWPFTFHAPPAPRLFPPPIARSRSSATVSRMLPMWRFPNTSARRP